MAPGCWPRWPAPGPGCGCSAGPPPAGARSRLWSLQAQLPCDQARRISPATEPGAIHPVSLALNPCHPPCWGPAADPCRVPPGLTLQQVGVRSVSNLPLGEAPAHLPVGASAHHTVLRGVLPAWRTHQRRRLPTAGPRGGRSQEGPASPDPTLRLQLTPVLPVSPAPAALGMGASGPGPSGKLGRWLSGAVPPAPGPRRAVWPPGCLQGVAVRGRASVPGPTLSGVTILPPGHPKRTERALIRDRPRVTAPPLPVKNRPFSRGPEKQGVTPTIRVGDPRSRPSSLSLFTQPLNPGLLMATCGKRVSWGQALGVLGRWIASGWGGVGGWARWCSLGAWGCGCRQEGPPQRACVAGGPAVPGAASPAPPGSGPRPCLSPAGSDFSPSARTPGGGERHIRVGVPRCPPYLPPCVPSPSPSPYATGQCVNAGGSELGAGAQGLRSELQNVCGSGRELGRGCWLSGGQQGAGALGGHVGGRAWRAVTWKPSTGISLVPYLLPPHRGTPHPGPHPGLPVTGGGWNMCKL